MAAREGAALSGAASGAAAGTAVMPGWGTAIGGVLGAVGGYMSGGAQDDAMADAKQQYQDMLNRVAGINIPDVQKQHLALQLLQQQGTLSPEAIRAIQMGPSALENVQIDPRLRENQAANLAMMQQIAQAGGIDPTQRAEIAQAMRQMQQQAQAQAAATEQGAEMRGMSSTGANLALQQMAGQQEVNRAGDIGQKLAAAAYQNKLNALTGASGLASNLRTQDYGEQANLAAARDRIAQLNANLMNTTNATNVEARNQAAAANLAAKQAIANQNANLQNQQQIYNKQLTQQQFQNEMAKATGQMRPSELMGQYQTGQAGQIGQQFSGTMAGIGSLANAYKNYNNPESKVTAQNETNTNNLMNYGNTIDGYLQNTDANFKKKLLNYDSNQSGV